MRGLTRRWIGPMCDVPQDAAARGRPSLADRVIAARGLGGEPRAESILRSPRLSMLHPPAELPGADAVAQRLVSAVREGRPLAIYGDYDADGVTATAVLWHVLRAASADAPIETYTPGRLEEGYGLHASVLRQMHARGVRTVVSVDCGITAHAAAEAAREIGLELLITDHHAPECDEQGVPRLPCAAAIAHPSLPGARAPFADICGAAVAFKVASRFAFHWCGGERVPRVFQEALARTVPLVALGTVADVVPLVDENRIFAAAGLAAIHGSGIEGLRALLFHSDIAGGTQVHSEDVAFRLAPRLNAIGRLGHAAQAVELLTTADPARARVIAAELGRRNDERRAIEQRIADEACRMAEAEGMTGGGAHVIALAHPEWHEGVVGVVCSKLVERFGRPAVLCCLRPDGSAKGSGRSVDGFDLVGAVRACSQHLDSCGGHAAAVGLTVRAGAWQAFREALESCCASGLSQRDLVPELRFDAEAWLDELSIASLRSLDPLRPFGRGHVEPTFLLRGLRVQAVPQVFGSARTHLQLHLASRLGRGAPVRAVWWGGARHVGALSRAVELDVVARARVDTWQGRERVQLDLGDAGVTA